MKYPKRSQYKHAKSQYRVRNWAEYEAGLKHARQLSSGVTTAQGRGNLSSLRSHATTPFFGDRPSSAAWTDLCPSGEPVHRATGREHPSGSLQIGQRLVEVSAGDALGLEFGADLCGVGFAGRLQDGQDSGGEAVGPSSGLASDPTAQGPDLFIDCGHFFPLLREQIPARPAQFRDALGAIPPLRLPLLLLLLSCQRE